MPLENAKAGTPGFSRNVATEVKAGKPVKQAVAIAYSKARGDDTRPDMSSNEFDTLKKLLVEFFGEEAKEPEHKKDTAQDSGVDPEPDPFHKLVADCDILNSKMDSAIRKDYDPLWKVRYTSSEYKYGETLSAREKDAETAKATVIRVLKGEGHKNIVIKSVTKTDF